MSSMGHHEICELDVCTRAVDHRPTKQLSRPMNSDPSPQIIADNLWLCAYPLKMLGADLRRNVTLIRLNSGKLVIHSTAPFSPEEIAAIRALGEPAWLLDGI